MARYITNHRQALPAAFVYDFRTVIPVFVTMKYLTLFFILCATAALAKDPDKVNVWSMQRAPAGTKSQHYTVRKSSSVI